MRSRRLRDRATDRNPISALTSRPRPARFRLQRLLELSTKARIFQTNPLMLERDPNPDAQLSDSLPIRSAEWIRPRIARPVAKQVIVQKGPKPSATAHLNEKFKGPHRRNRQTAPSARRVTGNSSSISCRGEGRIIRRDETIPREALAMATWVRAYVYDVRREQRARRSSRSRTHPQLMSSVHQGSAEILRTGIISKSGRRPRSGQPRQRSPVISE